MSIAQGAYEESERPAKAVPPFMLTRPEGERHPCLVTSPHSGSHYPDRLLDKLCVPLIDLRRTEDAFVDRMVGHAPALGATLLTATHARSYVDLNRDARELDSEMFSETMPGPAATPSPRVRAGLGCFPRIGARGEPIYAKKLSSSDGIARLAEVYSPYHEALAGEIAAMQQTFGCVLLLDCHSMPSRQPGRSELPDIVLGDRFGSSCTSQLTNLAERSFRRLGLSVTRNAPYAGGYTTRRYGRPRRQVHALQIEINRRLYMDEASVEPTEGLSALTDSINTVIAEICSLAERLRP